MVQKVRADLGKPVAPWFKKLNPEPRAIAEKLHKLVMSADPALRAELKWGMPCYSKNKMLCALMGAKGHVSIFFHHGRLLKDPKRLLAGTGKTVRSLKLTSAKDIPAAAIKTFVKGAVAIDAQF
ncbi:MAG TPA: DUF1801 domain-containing protein [Planctomycetota bacterium]|nr:DUF1801 domain-containing protein [Planctomycetota bacterium]